MPLICYIPKTFKAATLTRIQQCNEIIDAYRIQGLTLTLRQLYYRLVATGKIKDNTVREYKNLQRILNDARLAGLVDWSAVEDRGRHIQQYSSWSDAESILQSAAYGYKLDLWEEQKTHVEVWVEKDAQLGVIQKACDAWRCPYTSTRGHSSSSEVWSAAQRFRRTGKPCVVLHLADHDPSGVDMTRDLQERFQLFGAPVDVRRIALTFDQVQEFNPPPNPTKGTDTRSPAYEAEYGDECWELDALEPAYTVDLIQNHIQSCLDLEKWSNTLKRESDERQPILDISRNYQRVVRWLKENKNDEDSE